MRCSPTARNSAAPLLSMFSARAGSRITQYTLIAVALLAVTGCNSGSSESNSVANEIQQSEQRVESKHDLANRCYAMESLGRDAFVAKADDSYWADQKAVAQGSAFYMRPTGLGTYLFYDSDREFLAVQGNALTGQTIGPASQASEAADWTFEYDPRRGFTIATTGDGRQLAVDPSTGELVLAESDASEPARFGFKPRVGCAKFPEAGLNARGKTFSGTNPDGTVRGIADGHSHIATTSSSYGDTFHPFGITHALHDCEEKHGPEGSLDSLGNMLRDGTPVGTHQTQGWPDFPGWPTRGTYTHTQSYYMWVKRAWMGGLRILVTHALGNETLCRLTPVQGTECDEMDGAEAQIQQMVALQDYIDAQAGGPGEGFFRIVDTPADARQVIEEGKLAVVLAIEAEKLFNCGELFEAPTCTTADIEAGLERFHKLGVRSVFITHWYDNAFAGGGLFGPSELVLNVLNKIDTGNYYSVESCPEEGMGANLQSVGHYIEGDSALANAMNEAQSTVVPTYPEGPHCNSKGLTVLGKYLVERLIDKRMIIETDHLGAKAKNQVLDIAEAQNYPVYAGHFHAGGVSSDTQLERIYALGGLAAPVKPDAEDFPAKLEMLKTVASEEHYFAVPMSSDINGATAPGPPSEDGPRVSYPFQSIDGGVTFERQETGDRVFDYNEEGVAHYGLYPEWLEAIRLQENGDEAIDALFRSAEGYLQMWEKIAEK